MDSEHRDRMTFYKKFEEELNKSIHARTNCGSFTRAFGRGMDAHLSRLKIHRRLTTKWLNRLDLANKDEIAELSVRMVDCEGKLDFLDETVYMTAKSMKENRFKFKKVQKSLEELLAILEKEVKAIQDYKIKKLEEELLELKQLFTADFEMEENIDGKEK
ncbi:hypothetical protein PH210_02310 [Paenibacillus sp. BSR1-1]|uniref:hypothetical protein n=1 Tax=Paenibacillus sp. BSR1-1 TaxID=3020845 RepID=UPI0025B19F86|nr:hypothetical protein [Paenibacillus sp. BSR1-1]MDN3015036.1 hypothetical protein [Paenibacillus sp. BSR1-1]